MVAQDIVVDIACPVCQSTDREVVGRESGLNAVRCRNCGLYYIHPRRTLATKFDGTREGAMKKYGAIMRGEEEHPRDTNYVEHLQNIERFKRPGRLLDIGTHMGFFSRIAVKRGWEVQGVEPNPTKADLAREIFNLNVFTGFLSEAPFEEHSFDAATLIDVLEHVHDHPAILHDVRRFLKPDGLLMIKVPHGEYTKWKSDWFTRLRVHRICWDANEHVVHYTQPSLERMLNQNGFRVVKWVVAKPIRRLDYDAFDRRAWSDPVYVGRELVKKGLHRYGQLQMRARGSYFKLLPDIEVLAQPA